MTNKVLGGACAWAADVFSGAVISVWCCWISINKEGSSIVWLLGTNIGGRSKKLTFSTQKT